MKRVEIIVANGEIAHYEQFHHLPYLFQKSSAAEASGSVYMWKGLNPFNLQRHFDVLADFSPFATIISIPCNRYTISFIVIYHGKMYHNLYITIFSPIVNKADSYLNII